MDAVKNAELFAKNKHAGMTKKDGTTTHSKHLEEVVSRLKGLGITDPDIISAGWLHDTIEDTDTVFDDLDQKFGNSIAVLVLSLSKDKSLPKKPRERQYIKQLREASFNAKIIKLCDVSANLSNMKNGNHTNSMKRRVARQVRQYITAIKEDIAKRDDYPKAITILESINQTLKHLGQKTVPLQSKSKRCQSTTHI